MLAHEVFRWRDRHFGVVASGSPNQFDAGRPRHARCLPGRR
ncbi:hypothetical protein [Microbispora corallina]|nr:hypothetical protein [Microbispora corallina]